MRTATTSEEFFERKYRAETDPWNFATSPYEQQRYETILRAIDHRRYRRALEPGCSVGVLTYGLASLCDEVEAFDIAPSAAAAAQVRCRGLANVHVTSKAFDGDGIDGQFDLIVMSEIGYYFEVAELRRITTSLMSHLLPGGVIVAAHWLGISSDHLLMGDAVHDVLCSAFEHEGLVPELAERYPEFRLDRWTKVTQANDQPAENQQVKA
jgi:cyclopropane fatty-acyl-phospholipid synthase-like methyltransferase